MTTLSLSPLQGYTDYAFRNAHHHYIGGIDCYYAPYLKLQKDGSIKNSQLKDLLPQNNTVPRLVPQILAGNATQFLLLAKEIEALGYTEVNWNLGCPYPMVAKQGMGSGLLERPEAILEVLEKACSQTNLKLSIKTRLGYKDAGELEDVLPFINRYPITELIIHPRTGKQLYKGDVDLVSFAHYQTQSKPPVAYNGNISSLQLYQELIATHPQLKHIMLGRGILYNPFLGLEIKQEKSFSWEEKEEAFNHFHTALFQHYEHALSGPSHLMNKMLTLWEYFSHQYPHQHKVYKQIKKMNKPSQLLCYFEELGKQG